MSVDRERAAPRGRACWTDDDSRVLTFVVMLTAGIRGQGRLNQFLDITPVAGARFPRSIRPSLEGAMRHLLVTVLLLLLPVAAVADVVCVEDVCVVDVSFPMLVEVTISVAGTVPLAGDDLVINDTFVLRGSGGAQHLSANRSVINRRDHVGFRVSGDGVSATGSVEVVEGMETSFREASLGLVTPLYHLGFFSVPGTVDVGPFTREASFGAQSEGPPYVTVGEENSRLDGMASFSGIGFVPEPGTAVLLVLGATAMTVWRGRGKIAGAARNTGALRRPSTISA
jgi:hypothetical protein